MNLYGGDWANRKLPLTSVPGLCKAHMSTKTQWGKMGLSGHLCCLPPHQEGDQDGPAAQRDTLTRTAEPLPWPPGWKSVP